MHVIQCVSIQNPSRMKLMNVICNVKKNMNKESEHDEEL
jgi:hypothetical protein